MEGSVAEFFPGFFELHPPQVAKGKGQVRMEQPVIVIGPEELEPGAADGAKSFLKSHQSLAVLHVYEDHAGLKATKIGEYNREPTLRLGEPSQRQAKEINPVISPFKGHVKRNVRR